MELPKEFLDMRNWGAFKVPWFALLIIIFLLFFRWISNQEEPDFVQKLAIYAMGASVIAYAHFVTWSTTINNSRKKCPEKTVKTVVTETNQTGSVTTTKSTKIIEKTEANPRTKFDLHPGWQILFLSLHAVWFGCFWWYFGGLQTMLRS